MTAEGLPPAERPIAGPDGLPERAEPTDAPGLAADPRALQILSTEHWGLLTARSLVYNEAFARAGMFLTFLSASLVALALVGQALTFGREFIASAAAILAVDVVLGLATHVRIMDAAVDDLRAIHGMNRIRAGYAELSPRVLPYLSTSVHDDAPGVFGAYGTPGVRSGSEAILHGLSTTGGMIGAIVALLVAGLTAAILLFVPVPAAIAGLVAAIAFILTFGLLIRRSQQTIEHYQRSIVSRFPSPPEA